MTFKFKNSDIEVHDSWGVFFNNHIEELEKIERLIGSDFTPTGANVFKIFKLPLNEIKFVIIGQDPYPQRGVATGRSFEVINDSWTYVNRSLEAILVSIHYHVTGELIAYCDIIQRIKSKDWNIITPDRIFVQLESQSGCFFLNKTLTCEVNKKNSHERIWNDFTTNLVKYISKNTKSRWILWGSYAQTLESLIENKDSIIKAKHPAYFSYTGGQESKDRLFDFAKNSGIKEILCTTQPKLH